MAKAERKVTLIQPGGTEMGFGAYVAPDPEAAIKAAVARCRNTLKRLTIGEYKLHCEGITRSLKELMK